MKNLYYVLFATFAFTLFTTKVDAASISIKTNYTSITKGGYATVSTTVSSDSPLVSIEGTLSCTGAGSSTVSMNFDDSSNSLYTKTYSTTVKGNSVGTITCNVSGARITNMSTSDWQYLGNKSVTIKVVAPKVYSSNNNLSGLSVEGYTLSGAFNKNTLQYSLEVPNEIRKIKINATKEDKTATIDGIGERSLVEGSNKIEIKVTAENGTVKTYVINVTVKDLEPIVIKLDNKDYTVIRKKEQLPTATNFTESTTTVETFEVPSLINDTIGYTLIGLKDNEGNTNLYIYNQQNKTYTIYKESYFKGSTIYILDNNLKIPIGYTKTSLKLENETIIAYKIKEDSKYYLFYGLNIETGKENLYVYDSEEGTIQRYNDEENNEEYTEKEILYQCIIMGLGSLLIVTYLVLLISLITSSKKKKKLREKRLSKKETNE